MHILYLFASFRGRIGRQSYWVGTLTLMVVGFLGNVVDVASGAAQEGIGYGTAVTAMLLIYPTLALNTKRWHDRDRSGWWTLILLVPVFGAMWMSIQLGALRGVRWENRYGPDPLTHGRARLKE